VDGGAQVIAVIAAWASGPGKEEQLVTLARARAIENTSYVLLASQSGPGRSGRSMIVDPSGTILADAGSDGVGMLTADLSGDVLDEVRATVPSLAHRRYDVVPRAGDRGGAPTDG
jgi:predicted amidohydrolase